MLDFNQSVNASTVQASDLQIDVPHQPPASRLWMPIQSLFLYRRSQLVHTNATISNGAKSAVNSEAIDAYLKISISQPRRNLA